MQQPFIVLSLLGQVGWLTIQILWIDIQLVWNSLQLLWYDR